MERTYTARRLDVKERLAEMLKVLGDHQMSWPIRMGTAEGLAEMAHEYHGVIARSI